LDRLRRTLAERLAAAADPGRPAAPALPPATAAATGLPADPQGERPGEPPADLLDGVTA
jgi:hypothetical protein